MQSVIFYFYSLYLHTLCKTNSNSTTEVKPGKIERKEHDIKGPKFLDLIYYMTHCMAHKNLSNFQSSRSS